jgi:hypothetical protein
MIFGEFWIPQYKWQYVDWLQNKFPKDKSFSRKRKTQLQAIYLNTRKEERWLSKQYQL